jgi:murein DD-endopeptidase MepM/ murein hydrolase activator NlpD
MTLLPRTLLPRLIGTILIAVAIGIALVVVPPPAVAAGVATAARAGPTGSAWTWPLSGRPQVVRGFQPPAAPWGAGHRGVDLGSESGALVLAAGTGVVSYAGVVAGRGVVSIVHGPLRTTYEPVRATIRAGARVAAGAVIGHLDSRPSHCAPRACLHWGLRRGDTYLDPLTLVGGGPTRLLPIWGTGPPLQVRPNLPPSSLAADPAPVSRQPFDDARARAGPVHARPARPAGPAPDAAGRQPTPSAPPQSRPPPVAGVSVPLALAVVVGVASAAGAAAMTPRR